MRSSLQKMLAELPLAEEHSENQLVLCCDEAPQNTHGYSDSEAGSGYSYTESCRGFGEARQLSGFHFRVKCPIMSRILNIAMAMIDRTSSSKDLSLHSDLTCYQSCFDHQSEISNESSFFNYLEKNFSRPRVRQEYALCWPPPKKDINLCLEDSDTADDEDLYSMASEKKNDLGLMKLNSRSYTEALQAIEAELLSESCDSKYDELSLFSDSDEKSSEKSLDSPVGQSATIIPGWPLGQIPVVKNRQNGDEPRNRSSELQLVPVTEPLCWRLFGLEELKAATASFSEDNLIGRGGCSKVFKGCFSDGKKVAVKVLKQNKNASKDFYSEIDIISSLSHKHITAFLGACFENNQHIFVYDFMPEGSLDEHLHGTGMKSVLSWASRYNVALVIAEALNYLHKECRRPVIHRDVKSSNILLSSDLQPQLSDFGLAIWGPRQAADTNLVGTFGYIAPEYFMHGKVSEKVDVYSFGVVLLELISGNKPILDLVGLRGQQSLVKWAKPLMDSGDIRALADPKLADSFDTDQMQTLVSAAALCTCQSARARPTMTEVLRLLKGEISRQELAVTQAHHFRTWSEDDELWIASELDRPRMSLALMDTDEESTAIISARKLKRRHTIADYLERSH